MSKTERAPIIKLLNVAGGSLGVRRQVQSESTAIERFSRLVRQSTSHSLGKRSVIHTDSEPNWAFRTCSHGEPTRRSLRGGATDSGIR